MKHTIHLLDDEDYDLDDHVPPEIDFAALHRRAKEAGREYRGILRGTLVRLDPDVAEFFQTSKAVNEALRQVMREQEGGGAQQ